MKTLISVVALTIVIAPPAFAGSTLKHTKHETMSSYARSVSALVRQSPNDVYWGEQYVGTDPDPNIRFALLRQGPGGGLY